MAKLYGKKGGSSPGSGVTSFASRTGAVSPVAGDYAAFYLGVPISKTQAQMVALVGSFAPGQLYKITNAYNGTAVLTIAAISTTELATCGFGTFQNAVMSTPVACQIWYTLGVGTGKINRIYESVRNNDIRVGAQSQNCIDLFEFDDASWVNNIISNCNVDAYPPSGLNKCNLYSSYINWVNTFGADTFVGCTLIESQLNIADTQNTASLNGCIFTKGTLTTATDVDFNLTTCRIEDGKTLDISTLTSSGLTATGGVYNAQGSTFVCPVTLDAAPSSTIDLASVDGEDFTFCGFYSIGNSGGGVASVDNINSTTTHNIKLTYDGTGGNINLISGGNLYLSGGVTPLTLADAGNTAGFSDNQQLSGWNQNGDTFT